MKKESEVYTVRDIAENLSIDPQIVRRWIHSGKLKAVCRLTSTKQKRYLISKEALEEFFANNPWNNKSLRWFTVKELARNLFVCEETILRYIRSGKLKTTYDKNIDGNCRYLINEKDLEDFLNDNPKVVIRAKKRLELSESQN